MEVAYLLNNKYRVHEVAKDFKKNSKEITDILTKYATAPKNHMQVLEDRELSLIFEYLTQHNQVDNIESIYAEVYREPKAAPAPKGEPAKAAPQAQKPAAPAGSVTRERARAPAVSREPIRFMSNSSFLLGSKRTIHLPRSGRSSIFYRIAPFSTGVQLKFP